MRKYLIYNDDLTDIKITEIEKSVEEMNFEEECSFGENYFELTDTLWEQLKEQVLIQQIREITDKKKRRLMLNELEGEE